MYMSKHKISNDYCIVIVGDVNVNLSSPQSVLYIWHMLLSFRCNFVVVNFSFISEVHLYSLNLRGFWVE